jgi:hypothetical protein
VTSENVTPLREPEALPRLPPINIEAEQSLLGAFLCDNRALEAVADFLKPEHFASAMHARILEAIQKLFDRGQIANVVTLKATFIWRQSSHPAEPSSNAICGRAASPCRPRRRCACTACTGSMDAIRRASGAR